MKTTFIALGMLLASLGVQAQTFKASEVEAVDDQIYQALRTGDVNGLVKNMASDAILYGTDPKDYWPLAVFRKKLEEDKKNNSLHTDVKTLSREIKPMAGGKVAVVTKQAMWPFSKAPVREVSVYENTNGWKLKSMSLSLLLPDERLPELNGMVTLPSGSTSASGGGSAPKMRAGQDDPMAIWIYHVKPEKRQQFEGHMEKFWKAGDSALKSGKMTGAQADAYQKVRVQYPSRANEDGTLTYVFMADPFMPSANYEMEDFLRLTLSEEEVKSFENGFAESLARPYEGLYVQQKKH
ncbi:nuclear transport factor 2 family protein [Telluribacter sp.]|jgi:ketosteroid isomerase-like protein|uniref:nuclear transport factor 2 family protein n=1 Tax=Telluribacter sp. TaxID=1978767 RepID=UPI002E101C29|nr:nuclear transport factor 2 family protein [Telluribacter sp.]